MNSMDYVDNSGKPHSGIGITSFVLGLTTWFILLICFLIAGVAGMKHGADDTTEMISAAIGFVLAVIMGLASLCLGVVCLLQSDRKKIFGVLGIVLTTIAVLTITGLAIAASMSEDPPPAGTQAPGEN